MSNNTENVSSNEVVDKVVDEVVSSKYTWLTGGFMLGMCTMKIVSCVYNGCFPLERINFF